MLQQGIAPTVVTLGTLIAALCDCGQLEEAFEVKEMMARRYNVKPNAHVYASLMKGLCERGKVDAAVRLKEEMAGNAELGLDSPVYATLVRTLFRVGRKGEVVALLEEMKGKGIVADRVVYAMIPGFSEDERDFVAAFAVLDGGLPTLVPPDSGSGLIYLFLRDNHFSTTDSGGIALADAEYGLMGGATNWSWNQGFCGIGCRGVG